MGWRFEGHSFLPTMGGSFYVDRAETESGEAVSDGSSFQGLENTLRDPRKNGGKVKSEGGSKS